MEQLANNFEKMGYDGYIVIPGDIMVTNALDKIIVKSNRTLGAVPVIQSKLNSIWNINMKSWAVIMKNGQLLPVISCSCRKHER